MTEPKETPIVANVEKMIEFAADGIVSKTVMETRVGKVVLFCMAGGQSLSEHTASSPAIVQILQGSGTFRLGEDDKSAEKGDCFYMPAHLPHAVKADDRLVFVLTLFNLKTS